MIPRGMSLKQLRKFKIDKLNTKINNLKNV